MVNTGDENETASGKVSNSNNDDNGEQAFARPKGEIT